MLCYETFIYQKVVYDKNCRVKHVTEDGSAEYRGSLI